MSAIQIVSASAGSGKTYRLAEILEEEVASGRARPNAIVATTFTREAAAELMTRVRQRLIDRGLRVEAQLLEAARVGTVNSVCARIVEAAAFELGLPPELGTLDEAVARATFRHVLSELLTPEIRAELDALSHRMVEFHWVDVVPKLVELARANHIDPPKLREQAQACVDGFGAMFDASGDHAAVVAETIDALQRFIDEAPSRDDATNGTRQALGVARSALRSLTRGRALQWRDWCKLCKVAAARKCKDLTTAINNAASQHMRSPELWRDARRSIELCFGLAADALQRYQDHKRAWGSIDFTDQEVFALEALRREDLRTRLVGSIDLVLVDEFQDTSPLQLAIFVELASIAKRSVWVGDQKQAIYGFRGTDPELMDAAIASILGGGEPETLGRSWRSRAPLVELTSEAFAPAFEQHGIPASRVRLEAAETRDPAALGPVLEAWTLSSTNLDRDPYAVADGVAQLLADDSIRVRERISVRADVEPVARRLRPGDLAVLCRTNDACRIAAAALEALGLRAAVPRAGLLTTPEARACIAGLRIFCDPSDALARAELARLAYEGDPDAWLEELLRAERGHAFAEHPLVERITALAKHHPETGGVTALDLVIDAVEADELCRRWGDAARRRANLDALRAHSVVLRDTALATGTATTPAALVVGLEALADDESDARAVAAGDDAITVSTWHAAKGREWPITVLADIREFGPRTLGLRAYTRDGEFSFDDPLANRVIRYWPNPYHAQNNGMDFHDRLDRHPESERTLRLRDAEDLRLLYVGWTRARDRLIVAGRPGAFRESILDRLQPAGFDVDAGLFRVGDREIPMLVRRCEAFEEGVARELEPSDGPVLREVVEHPPAWVSPSEIELRGAVVRMTRLGGRLATGQGIDRSDLGQAVHGFLAADREDLDEVRRLQLAADLLERWRLPESVPAVSLVEMSDRLRTWLATRWTVTALHREVPLAHTLPEGTIVAGVADLLAETSEGWVVVDHKTREDELPDNLERYAAGVVGQLESYAGALRAVGREVIGLVVHFPTVGVVAEVAPAQPNADLATMPT